MKESVVQHGDTKGQQTHVGITLPETNIAAENGWLEDDCFLLGWRNLAGAMLVSGRVSSFPMMMFLDVSLGGSGPTN